MQQIVRTEVAEHVKRIIKRINDEPGFRVDKVSLVSCDDTPPYHLFNMQVGAHLVFHIFNITASLPRPDDVVASLRDEYDFALE